MFKNLARKHILIGVTGGIAAYKIASLISLLKKEGAEVKVIMTKAATEFITPLTLQTLSGNSVYLEMFHQRLEADVEHISLARWADCLLIAPATANIIAKLAHGLADDLLSTVSLATKAPICVAPAMNIAMWNNAMLQKNISTLQENSIKILGPGSGLQACGETGYGRLIEPVELLNHLNLLFKTAQLKGKKVLITAGPTVEAIDPVRYIGNKSSGKMGYAITRAVIDSGADVTLISGPTSLEKPCGVNKFISIESADEMYNAVMQYAPASDIYISVAAIADYRPENAKDNKIKKNDEQLSLSLIRNRDILKEVATSNDQIFTVGFAAETENLEDYAKSKLASKRLDMIAANIVGNNVGFNSNRNKLTVFTKSGQSIALTENSKEELSYQLVNIIASNIKQQRS